MLIPPRLAAALGWYGADVRGEPVAATVKFDSYDQLGQNLDRESTRK
jgi:hypothetical protein